MAGKWGKNEFSHSEGTVYLDHAGATLYAKSQLEACFEDLSTHLYGNPHSRNPSSKFSTDTIDQTRELILNHFGTDSDHYNIVFTSGCTASLKLLSEIFPWNGENKASTVLSSSDDPAKIDSTVLYIPVDKLDPQQGLTGNQSIFCYLEDNHTSVIGMREIANQNGAKIVCITDNAIIMGTKETAPFSDTFPTAGPPLYHLFAYPAQSNFSGQKYPLLWTTRLPNKEVSITGLQSVKGVWLVLLDAASYVSTNPLDLKQYPAHFVTISFYKIFGFPTGLGALLIRHDIGELLRKTYFGGGTVLTSIARNRFHQPRPLPHERFEDGTVSFLDIASLRHGFETLKRFGLTMQLISEHTFQLAQLVYNEMVALKHSNGRSLCVLYHRENFSDIAKQGAILAFNLLRSDGSFIGYSEVDKLACVYNVHLRTGCFCNPGACQYYLGLNSDQILNNFKAGHTCGDDIDLINGYPTGCVRISFGYMSTKQDAITFLDFIKTCFINMETINQDGSTIVATDVAKIIQYNFTHERDHQVVLRVRSDVQCYKNTDGAIENCKLEKLILYPVKSCGKFEVEFWPVGKRGLLWDREWMVVNEIGACLSQKQEPKLALIKPSFDIETNKLTLKFTDSSVSDITVTAYQPNTTHDNIVCRSKVCGDKIQGLDCGDDVAVWLCHVLGRQCRLVQMNPNFHREIKTQTGDHTSLGISLANAAQYLLLTQSSINHLHTILTDKLGQDNTPTVDDLISRFRPNLVVNSCNSTFKPFSEDEWKTVVIGHQTLQVVDGCTRCQMICVDQKTGLRSTEPLQTLLTIRGNKAKFGLYLTNH